MTRSSRKYLSRSTLVSIIKSNEKKGHISLESLASWNPKQKSATPSNGFVCKKQHEQIEETILKSSLESDAIKHILHTVDILKKNRTGK